MKSFLGLGPAAWAASMVVHVGLAGSYALAPATNAPGVEAPLVVELINLEVSAPPDPTIVDPIKAVADRVAVARQMTPDLPQPAAPPFLDAEVQTAALQPVPPSPVPFEVVQLDFSVVLEPVAVPVAEPVIPPATENIVNQIVELTPVEHEPPVVWLPKDKPLAPAPVKPKYVEPVEELTLDQIASAKVRPAPQEMPLPVEPVKPAVLSETPALLTDPAPDQAEPEQVAAVLSPVVLRADRFHTADPKAVARVKGRGAFQAARLLPVGTVNRRPSYPYAARKRGHEGRVVLHVAVSAMGAAMEVNVVRSAGYKSLDKAAQSTVQRWKFKAARRAGVRVQGMVITPIVFRLKN